MKTYLIDGNKYQYETSFECIIVLWNSELKTEVLVQTSNEYEIEEKLISGHYTKITY